MSGVNPAARHTHAHVKGALCYTPSKRVASPPAEDGAHNQAKYSRPGPSTTTVALHSLAIFKTWAFG